MENILEIKNLEVGFTIEENFYYVSKGINLSFEKGKIHAIAGESGCGKSVLINTILKLLPKNALIKSGEIIFKGQNILDFSQKEFSKIRGREIFLIPQDPFSSLNPLYTIKNQMEEIIEDKKNSKDLLKSSLEEVRIKDVDMVLKSYPHELSGGMKQRVIIAMALISKSELILADEPTTALDASVSNSILDLLVNLKEKGKTIILITHDLSIVSNYCDTTTIMYLGDIVEAQNTKEFFKNPRHPYTKALIGALPTTRGKKLENIEGQISPITKPVEGCKFHPRCKMAFSKCRHEKPKFKNNIACWLYE
ncbi:ABC transporter ATP-binding protein [bacterium]|nr:ABC transporter ATP-binding protein [bacterium]